MKAEFVRIDTAGRLVLPKTVRDKLHLHHGDSVRLTFDATGLRLEPVKSVGALEREGSVLVFAGDPKEPITVELVESLLAEHRNNRGFESPKGCGG